MRNLALVVSLLSPMQAWAQAVVTVLSSETGPYREALAGFQQGFGATAPSFVLTQGEPKIPDSTRVVVVFGSKAAQRNYANRLLVYAMAPGTVIKIPGATKIYMEPNAGRLLTSLREIYPHLNRLGILWESQQFKGYIDELHESAGPLGIVIADRSPKSVADVPERLRELYGKIDALWLPPDPLLLNAGSLPVFIEFSRSNKIPLFVPTGGLVEQGATASVGPSFREMGRLAGIEANKALQGLAQESAIHADSVEIVINRTVATDIGLKIPKEVLRKADRVVP